MQVDPDLAQTWSMVCLKDYTCAINPLYHLVKVSKFEPSYESLTENLSHQETSQSRGVNLQRCPQTKVEILKRSPLPCRRAQVLLGCSLFRR